MSLHERSVEISLDISNLPFLWVREIKWKHSDTHPQKCGGQKDERLTRTILMLTKFDFCVETAGGWCKGMCFQALPCTTIQMKEVYIPQREGNHFSYSHNILTTKIASEICVFFYLF